MARRATVGTRELKTRLGGYLEDLRQGMTLVITDRGKPVAELKRLAGTTSDDACVARLMALGVVTRLERRRLAPFRPIRSCGRSVSEAILDDRDREGSAQLAYRREGASCSSRTWTDGSTESD